jgi:hypothetical protein
MTKKSESKSAAAVLRQQAAELVKKNSSQAASKLTDAETIQFIKEMQLRQAELQLLVEELLVEKLVAKETIEDIQNFLKAPMPDILKLTKQARSLS